LRQGLNRVARKTNAGRRTAHKRATKGAPFGPESARHWARTTGESPAAARQKKRSHVLGATQTHLMLKTTQKLLKNKAVQPTLTPH